jgi:hypothetical protein
LAFHARQEDPSAIYFTASLCNVLSFFSPETSEFRLWQRTFDLGATEILLHETFHAVATKVSSSSWDEIRSIDASLFSLRAKLSGLRYSSDHTLRQEHSALQGGTRTVPLTNGENWASI